MNKYILFINHFYDLLKSGYSVIDALMITYSIYNEDYIERLIHDLMSGEDIYNLIIDLPLPKIFKDYFYFYKNKNSLSDALEKSIKIYEHSYSYKQKFISQITYPLMLMLFLFIFSLFVVFFLLPQMIILFDSFQVETSLLTDLMFRMFHVIPLIYMFMIIFVGFLVFYLIYALKHKLNRIIEIYLKIPYISEWLKKYFSIYFALYYYELSLDNMDSAAIIQLLNEILKEHELKIVLYEMNERMKQGEMIEEIIDQNIYLDSLLLIFFKLYLKNPSLDHSLLKYVELTYESIDHFISRSIKKFIPFVYCFVSVFVIGIYIAIIIPMMNIVSGI